MKLQFPEKSYREAVKHYDCRWRLLDSTLYDLCSQHPKHTDIAAVTAKVFLIGRGYATGIERQMESDGRQAGAIERVADLLCENAEQVDLFIAPILRVSGWSDPEAVEQVATAHRGLTGMLRQITRGNRRPQSFVSKYLHFHAPIVPIYDTLAVEALKQLVPADRRTEGELDYLDFLRRFAALASSAPADIEVTSKHLDHCLVRLAEESRRRS